MIKYVKHIKIITCYLSLCKPQRISVKIKYLRSTSKVCWWDASILFILVSMCRGTRYKKLLCLMLPTEVQCKCVVTWRRPLLAGRCRAVRPSPRPLLSWYRLVEPALCLQWRHHTHYLTRLQKYFTLFSHLFSSCGGRILGPPAFCHHFLWSPVIFLLNLMLVRSHLPQ